jgi:hypothetical protein
VGSIPPPLPTFFQINTLSDRAARKPIGELLSKTIAEKGVESAIKQYHELKSTQLNRF